MVKKRERGNAMIEYTFISAILSISLIISTQIVAQNLVENFGNMQEALMNAAAGGTGGDDGEGEGDG